MEKTIQRIRKGTIIFAIASVAARFVIGVMSALAITGTMHEYSNQLSMMYSSITSMTTLFSNMVSTIAYALILIILALLLDPKKVVPIFTKKEQIPMMPPAAQTPPPTNEK